MGLPFDHHTYTGRITLEYWEKTSPASAGSIVESKNLPENPDGRTTIEDFSILAGWTGKHSVRIRGYVHPPVTGAYTFTSCGHVDLYIGMNPLDGSSRQILSTTSKCSDAVLLQAGTCYFIKAVCASGDDDCAMHVGWQMPDGTQMEVISGSYLSPYNRFQDDSSCAQCAFRLEPETSPHTGVSLRLCCTPKPHFTGWSNDRVL